MWEQRRSRLGILFLLAAVALLAVGNFLHAQQYKEELFKGMKWRLIGPFRGGRVLAVTGVSGRPDTYYFGGVSGGVWKTQRIYAASRSVFKPYLARDAEVASRLPSHPQRVPRRGIGPRRFDHANFLVDAVEPEQVWLTSELGIHHRYYLESVGGARVGSWLSRTNVSHEIGIMRNRNQNGALLHHIECHVPLLL
jgi:hypothetical protein